MKAKHQAVRRHWLLRVADALAKIECANQRGNPGRDVNHGATGKIESRESPAQ